MKKALLITVGSLALISSIHFYLAPKDDNSNLRPEPGHKVVSWSVEALKSGCPEPGHRYQTEAPPAREVAKKEESLPTVEWARAALRKTMADYQGVPIDE